MMAGDDSAPNGLGLVPADIDSKTKMIMDPVTSLEHRRAWPRSQELLLCQRPAEVWTRLGLALVVVGASMTSGCGTFMRGSAKSGEFMHLEMKAYPATTIDAVLFGWGMPMAIFDLPFSLVTDTLLLPYDLATAKPDPRWSHGSVSLPTTPIRPEWSLYSAQYQTATTHVAGAGAT